MEVEARIYAVPQDETLVAKVYQPSVAHAQKTRYANPPENRRQDKGHISIAWPVELRRRLVVMPSLHRSDRVVGFLMPRVKDALHPDFTIQTRRKSARSSTIHICTALRAILLLLLGPHAWILHRRCERVKYLLRCDTGRHRLFQGANLIKVLFTAALLVSLSSPHLNSRVRVFTQWIARSNMICLVGSAIFNC